MGIILFWLVLVFGVFFLPLILAVVAMTKVSRLRLEVDALRREVTGKPGATAPTRPPPQTATPAQPAPQPGPVSPSPVPTPAPEPPPPLPKTRPPSPAIRASSEIWLGGRMASFVGIGLLLVGGALLIGYAVRHAWLGPAARVALGLLGGAMLIGLGHAAEVRGSGRLTVLARVLTGGGTALFYFSLYAAFGLYALIGPVAAALGLLAAAAATIGLAHVYRSQAVAVIGVVGAFAMPALIQDDVRRMMVLLAYMAAVNVPVIALGLRRKWQGLYNTAFGFTIAYQGLLLFDLTRTEAPWLLGFAILFFLQFATLGLLKLRTEKTQRSRQADIIRLTLNSLCLLGMTYAVLQRWDQAVWMGAALLALAGLHLGLAKLAWRWFPAFVDDVLALLMGALLFASLALPAQLDGPWISVGWSLMGVVVCVLALRANVPLLQGGALLLGWIGLLKSLGVDWHSYAVAPTLFLNARFLAGCCTAALLGAQGWLHQRSGPVADPAGSASTNRWGDRLNGWAVTLPAWALGGIWLLFMADIFWTIGWRDPWAWLLSSGAWIALAVVSGVWGVAQPAVARFGHWLLCALPLKLMVAVWVWFAVPTAYLPDRAFVHGLFLGFAGLIFLTAGLAHRFAADRRTPITHWPLATWLHLGTVAALVFLVTTELQRLDHAWTPALITLAWAGAASSLAVWGMWRRRAAYRYAGLALFAATTAKVIWVDLALLEGLARIAAFMGVGILLLFLSYLYQRMAAHLAAPEESPHD